MKQPLVEKLASTALSRRLNEPGRFMSVGGAAAGANVNTAFKGARNSATNALGAGHPEIMQRAVAAKGAAGGKIGASTARNLVSGEGKDLLATTSIRQRLEGHRATLGLSAANGDRAKQIGNANALRAGKERGMIGGELTAKSVNPTVTSNADSIRKGLADSAAGHHVHMDIGNGHVGVSSARPMAAAKPGLLDRAKSLAGMAMGKFKGLSTAKKLAVGAGAGLAAYGAKKMLSSNDQQEKWASDMSNKYLEKLAKEPDYDPIRTGGRAIVQGVGGAIVGEVLGNIAGGGVGRLISLRGPLAKAPLTIAKSRYIGQTIGTGVGALHGIGYGIHASRKNQRKEQEKYANADTSEVHAIDYNAALGRMLSKG